MKTDWLEWAMGGLLCLVATAAIALVAYGVFVAADSWFIEDRIWTAEVVGRDHAAAWVQTVHHSDGKGGGWNQIIYHPETWTLRLNVAGQEDNVPASEHDYNTVRTGEQVRVKYRYGRLSSGLYVTEAFFR